MCISFNNIQVPTTTTTIEYQFTSRKKKSFLKLRPKLPWEAKKKLEFRTVWEKNVYQVS